MSEYPFAEIAKEIEAYIENPGRFLADLKGGPMNIAIEIANRLRPFWPVDAEAVLTPEGAEVLYRRVYDSGETEVEHGNSGQTRSLSFRADYGTEEIELRSWSPPEP